MKMFDPHIHMTSRTTDDYAGDGRAPASSRSSSRRSGSVSRARTSASFEDYFLSLIGWERFRASQFGIRHFCTIALNPKEANNPSVADGVLELMPRYLEKDGVVAVGEIGFDDMTRGRGEVLRDAARAGARRSTCRCWSTRRTATRSAAPSARSR